MPIGKGQIRREGHATAVPRVALRVVGPPFDAELVRELARRHELLVARAFNCRIQVQCAA